MPPLCSTRPPALVSPPELSEWVRGPGGGYLGHRLRPSLRRAVSRGGGAGALRGCPSPEAATSPGAARVWVGYRLAAPLKGPRLRPRPAFGPAPGRPAVRSGRPEA